MAQTEFTHTKTIEFPGMVARVFSPVLTAEERSKRMQNIHNKSAILLKEVERLKK